MNILFEYPHKVNLKRKVGSWYEISVWLIDHGKDFWKCRYHNNGIERNYYFSDKNIAVLFKLTFG